MLAVHRSLQATVIFAPFLPIFAVIQKVFGSFCVHPQNSPPRFLMIIIYDGVCHLCAFVVKFVIHRDPAKIFKFCALQSQAAQPFLKSMGVSREDALKSFIVYDPASGLVSRRSDAALLIGTKLCAPFPFLASLGYWVPKLLRDAVYDCVATRRYALFGRAEEGEMCLMPTKSVLARMLDAEEVVAALKAKAVKERETEKFVGEMGGEGVGTFGDKSKLQ
jgi:predicted DCC family thiol-disulfide oxidoreductase YuxK